MAAATNVKVTVKTGRSSARGCCPRTTEAHHRFLLPAGSSRLEQLRTHIAQAVCAEDSCTKLAFGSLVYIDDDGDAVQLRSDADLQAALATLPRARSGSGSSEPDGGQEFGDDGNDRSGRGGTAVLRLQLDSTVTPPAPPSSGCGAPCGAGGPCCFLKGLFAFLFVYHAFRWCCPCMFAVMFAVGLAKLVGFCCHARCQPPAAAAAGCSGAFKQQPTTTPDGAFWSCPLRGGCGGLRRRSPQQFHVFTTTGPAEATEPATAATAAGRLARAWDIGLPEAAAAIQRAQADPTVRELVATALRPLSTATTPPPLASQNQPATATATAGTGTTSSPSETDPAAAAGAGAAPRGLVEAELAQHEAAAAELRRQIELLARLDDAAVALPTAATNRAAAELELEHFVAVDPPAPAPSPVLVAAAVAASPLPLQPDAAPQQLEADDGGENGRGGKQRDSDSGSTGGSKLAILTKTMGFDDAAAAAALVATGGDVRAAIQKLIAVEQQ